MGGGLIVSCDEVNCYRQNKNIFFGGTSGISIAASYMSSKYYQFQLCSSKREREPPLFLIHTTYSKKHWK